MAMGKRKLRQESQFVTTDQLTPSAGHPFYQKLNALLAESGFDRWIERRCIAHYECEEKRGQPSLPPGVYFRMLLIGYVGRGGTSLSGPLAGVHERERHCRPAGTSS